MNKDLKQIQQDVSRGTLVLENLLLLARLDPRKTNDLPKSKIDLEALIQDVISALKPFVDEKQINIKMSVAQDVCIHVNKELIFTCIRNILDNAIRYISMNGEIYIQVLKQSHQTEIVITDKGTKTTGSGLGISICQKIIELHHGQLSFSKSEQGGLIVKISLPN